MWASQQRAGQQLPVPRTQLPDLDLRSQCVRIAEYAAADRRERNRRHFVLRPKPQRVRVARRQQLRFARVAAMPDRPDGMDHEACRQPMPAGDRSEEHTSELQSLMRISYAVFCLKKQKRYV